MLPAVGGLLTGGSVDAGGSPVPRHVLCPGVSSKVLE